MGQGQPTWTNWARTVSTRPGAVERPPDVAALQATVAQAAAHGRRLRVAGSGHSWSACAAPDDVWVRLDALPRNIDIQADVVHVRGVVPLRALVDALWSAGRMLPNLGTITAQTVVGATATGTHGTGASLPILSDGVVRMELIDGRGEEQVLAAGDPALSTARVHLGALGLVTRVSLRTVPARRLHERLVNLPLEAALERLPELLNHAHARLWWLPQTGVVQVYTADPTEEPDTGPAALPVRMDRWGLQAPLLRFLLGLGLAWPALVPSIHRFAQATNFRDRERVEAQHHVLTLAVPPRHDEVEVAFGIEDAADLIAELWRMSHRDGRCPDFIQEVRFVRGDTAALSPAHGRDSVYLGAYCTNPRVAAPYHADLLALARQAHGRPHWGKRFDHTAAELAPLYPRWAEFQALRARLDPQGIFRSAWQDRVLGPIGEARRG